MESSQGVRRTEAAELIYLIGFRCMDAGASDDVGLSCQEVPVPLGRMLFVLVFF